MLRNRLKFEEFINKSVCTLFLFISIYFYLFLFISIYFYLFSLVKETISYHLTISRIIFNFSLRILLIFDDVPCFKTGNFAKIEL
jgi:hypothetical protein